MPPKLIKLQTNKDIMIGTISCFTQLKEASSNMMDDVRCNFC